MNSQKTKKYTLVVVIIAVLAFASSHIKDFISGLVEGAQGYDKK